MPPARRPGAFSILILEMWAAAFVRYVALRLPLANSRRSPSIKLLGLPSPVAGKHLRFRSPIH
jgi:hypothetical protein